MADHWFFFSHARVDRSEYLTHFFESLARAVRAAAALPSTRPPHDVGFYDSGSIDVGDDWSDELVNGLQTARTFVPILSPGYLGSPNCARELTAFQARLRADTSRGNRDRVLPVMWPPPAHVALPPVLERIQWSHATLGDAYTERGLRYWAHRSSSPEFQDFVNEFAYRVVAAARDPVPPPLDPAPRWAELSGTFSTSADRAPTEVPGTAATAPPVPTARFVYVAGRPGELAAHRTDVTGYADNSAWWRPFTPVDDTAVGLTAQAVAAREGHLYTTLDVDEALVEHVRAAEDAGEIVLVLVDPWTVRVDRFRSPVRDLDERRFVNYGVLVPLATAHRDAAPHADALRTGVRDTLTRTYIADPTYIRDAIETREELEAALVGAIADARRRMAAINRVRPWAGPSRQPLVSGPQDVA